VFILGCPLIREHVFIKTDKLLFIFLRSGLHEPILDRILLFYVNKFES